MRTVLPAALVLVAASSLAMAERVPVVSLGFTAATRGDANAATSFDEVVGGGRLQLTFEDAPLAYPAPAHTAREMRLVPEVLAGFLSNDTHAEGFVGAGLRAELQLARNAVRPFAFRMRMAMYLAARAEIVGKHQDPGGEFAIGEYILLGRRGRFGWEAGIGARRLGASGAAATQLVTSVTVYYGWQL